MRSLALACCCLAGILCGQARAAERPTPPLSHSGRWITDAAGRVRIVHGVNMVYKLPPYDPAAAGFGDDDAAFLARIGFNAVRVGIIWKALEPSPGTYEDAYLARIASTVRMLARHGVMSLLDFHQDMLNERFQGEGIPDWAVQALGPPEPVARLPWQLPRQPRARARARRVLRRRCGPRWRRRPDPLRGRMGARRCPVLRTAFGARLRAVQRAVPGNGLAAVRSAGRLHRVRLAADGLLPPRRSPASAAPTAARSSGMSRTRCSTAARRRTSGRSATAPSASRSTTTA